MEWEDFVYKAKANSIVGPQEWPYVDFHLKVSRELVPGYVIQHLSDAEDKPTLTGLQIAFGTLQYGNVKPTRIMASEKITNQFDYIIRDWNRNNLLGALWFETDVDPENMVILLNEDYPIEPKYNGAYLVKE